MKKQNKKQRKKTSGCASKVVICILSAIIVALGVTGAIVFSNLCAANEERDKRNAVFENLAASYIRQTPMVGDEKEIYDIIAEYDGSGLSEDGDIYIDFSLEYYGKDSYSVIPEKTRKGRLHFQGDYYNNTNNDPEQYRFAHAYYYYDEQ